MKEQYKELELEVIEFDSEDIIVTSGPDVGNDNIPGGPESWG